MRMTGPLHVVAIGARTPVGLTAETTAAAVRAGVIRMATFPLALDTGEPLTLAADARLDAGLEGPARLAQLGRSVISEVIGKCGPLLAAEGRFTVRLVVPEQRPGWRLVDDDVVVHALRGHLQELGVAVAVEVGGRGNAGFAAVMAQCLDQSAELRPTLVLGLDSHHHPDTLAWLEGERRFGPRARDRSVPGEGAGGLLLLRPEARRRLGMRCLVQVTGAGTAMERCTRECETGSLGVALAEATGAAVARLHLPDEAVDTVYLDVNGERYRSEEWGFAAMRMPWAIREIRPEVPADSWGDVGAASGPLATVLAARSWARHHTRGPRAITMAGSRCGLRGAVLLERPCDAGTRHAP